MRKINRILLLTDKLITGGAEIYFCKLENHLNDQNMIFYSAAAPGELVKGIKNKQNFIPLSLKNHPVNIIRLCKQVMVREITTIHANSLRMLLYSIIIKKCTRKNVEIIYTKHNVTVLEKKMPALFKKIVNKQVNQIIAVCHFEKEKLLSAGIDRERIRTIYNGVDVQNIAYKPPQKKENFNVGILARLSKEKNHELFLKIASELKDIDRIQFYIAGDGHERDHIETIIRALHLEDKVKMLGNVTDPYEFITQMDLLLLTSHREVFPMSVLEAMAAGTPVVSVNAGGIQEAIQNYETGVLIPHHSEQAFSEQIRHLYNKEEVRKQISFAARKKVESAFSLRKMIDSTLEVYKNR